MKAIITLSLLFLLAQRAGAQKIHFGDSTNTWKVFSFDPDRAIYFQLYRHHGIATFNGNTYDSIGNFAVREDTAARKVYIVNRQFIDSDTAEYLLYDFNLQVADTLKTRFAHHYVDAIDSIRVNGTWHKKWSFIPCWKDSARFDNPRPYIVVEGIGSLSGPKFPDDPFTFEISDVLVCFENQGIRPALSPAPSYYFNNTSTCESSFGLEVNTLSNHFTAPLPNPVTDETALVVPAGTSAVVTLTGLTGTVAATIAVNGETHINIGRMLTIPGIYFYTVTDMKSSGINRGRLVKY